MVFHIKSISIFDNHDGGSWLLTFWGEILKKKKIGKLASLGMITSG